MKKFRRHTVDRSFQLILMVFSQVVAVVLRNRVEGYSMDKLKLAFHDTEVVLLAHYFLNVVLLAACASLLLLNAVGWYNKTNEDPV